jgi:hypothetical protein
MSNWFYRRWCNIEVTVCWLWEKRDSWFWLFVFLSILFTVFLILYFENPAIIDGGVTGFVQREASHILMALLMAFLGALLVRIELVEKALGAHRRKWEDAGEELKSLKRDFNRTKTELDGVRKELVSSVMLDRNVEKIRARFQSSSGRDISNSIIEKSTKLALGWTEYIRPDKTDTRDEKVQNLEHMCWQFAFNAYMDEEYLDISATGRPPGEPPGAILATNYPTYLEFLKVISSKFTTAAQEANFTPCFLSLADTHPIEWVMICDRLVTQAGIRLDCSANSLLAKWRKTSAELARNPNVAFRRVFLTKSEDTSGEFRVPYTNAFMLQLNWHIWTLSGDEDMESSCQELCKLIFQAASFSV